MELPGDVTEMSKHVGMWIMYTDIIVIHTFVLLNVHFLVIIKIKNN